MVLFARLVGAWMQGGELARLIGQKREEAARRQAVARRVFGAAGLAYSAGPSSFHCWLPLAPGTDLVALEQRLLTEGVEIVSGQAYRADPASPEAGIRVALGNVDDEATLAAVLHTVARCLRG